MPFFFVQGQTSITVNFGYKGLRDLVNKVEGILKAKMRDNRNITYEGRIKRNPSFARMRKGRISVHKNQLTVLFYIFIVSPDLTVYCLLSISSHTCVRVGLYIFVPSAL